MQTTPSPGENDPKKGELWKFLDNVEEYLYRMITGLVRFIIVKVPTWIYHFFDDWMPTIVKFIRVLFIAIVFITITFGPASIAIWLDVPIWLSIILYMWSLAALVGSIWGLVYMRIKRRRLLQALRQAVAQNDVEAGEIE